MILSGKQIHEKLGTEIIIDPFTEHQLNPNSYNLTLHNELLVYTDPILDMKKNNKTRSIIIPQEGFVLEPQRLYLARTHEYISTDYYVPMLEGRSSIARLGLFVHVTAGFGNIGSAGYWTLELVATQPIRIYAGIQICQIYFEQLYGSYDIYSNKYKDSTDIQPSYLYKELNRKKI
jgi:dCTP deaminase